jgi:hypothetical protein
MRREFSDKLSAGQHTLVIQALFPDDQPKGQLRIESLCVAGQ